MPTYPPPPVTFVRGEGTELWDDDGKRYLDFLVRPGRHVLGHAHPAVADALAEQARTLLHVSNLFGTEPRPRGGRHPRPAARRRRPGLLLQLGRRGQRVRHQAGPQVRRPGPPRAWSAPTARSTAGRWPRSTPPASPQKHEPFQPLPEGFRHVAWDDLDALEAALDPTVAAVLLEPVQGEGGVQPGHRRVLPGRAPAVRRAGRAVHGRRGADRPRPHRARGSASSTSASQPDVVTMAKALGNGVPIGACWARAEVAAAFEPGDHATTFGGQPLATAAARAVLAVMEARGRARPGRGRRASGCATALERARRRGRRCGASACCWRPSCDGLDAREVGRGRPRAPAWSSTRSRPTALRLAPSLLVTDDEIDEAVAILGEVLRRDEALPRGRRPHRRTSSPTVLDLAERPDPPQVLAGKGMALCSRSRRPAPATRRRWRSCSSAATR